MNHPDEEVQRAAADPNAGGLSPKQLAIEAAKRLKQVLDGNDQREACERVYGSYERSDELGPIDCRTVVDYLTSLPQPDPGPIDDAEWLESIGAVRSEHGEAYFIWSIAIGQGCGVDVDSDGDVFVEHGSEYRIVPRCLCNTRDKVLEIIQTLKGGAE